MMSVFQLFKMILGLVTASFFLFFLLKFSGIYTTFQGGQNELDTMNGFLDVARGVYIYGDPVEFKGFSGSGRYSKLRYEPPFIYSGAMEAKATGVTLFMIPGKTLNVYRTTVDVGWWKYSAIGALPLMKVYYSPVNCNSDCWRAMEKLTMAFPGPGEPRVSFGFCNGTGLTETVDRDYLATRLEAIALGYEDAFSFEPCGHRAKPDELVVEFVSGETYPTNGFAVDALDDATGYVYYARTSDMSGRLEKHKLAYKDPLDILAIVTGGEAGFEYKNENMFAELETAAKKESARAEMLAGAYARPGVRDQRCSAAYGNLREAMNNLTALMDNPRPDDLESMRLLNEAHASAAAVYEGLRGSGCE